MFYNNAVCDIYIGKSAGKKLMEDIRNAKKNVKIVSPYLSPFLIRELISLHSKGISIHLITTDNVEDFYGDEKNIHKLIIQDKMISKKAKNSRDSLVSLSQTLIFVMTALAVILLAAIFMVKEFWPAYGLVLIAVLFFIRNSILDKIKQIRVYRYTYRQLFPFKVFIGAQSGSSFNKTFIHSKIYIIDDEIAYMGSLNFTKSGLKENYETRIRTTDRAAVHKIAGEVNDLFQHSNLAERDIQFWGSQLYEEPFN